MHLSRLAMPAFNSFFSSDFSSSFSFPSWFLPLFHFVLLQFDFGFWCRNPAISFSSFASKLWKFPIESLVAPFRQTQVPLSIEGDSKWRRRKSFVERELVEHWTQSRRSKNALKKNDNDLGNKGGAMTFSYQALLWQENKPKKHVIPVSPWPGQFKEKENVGISKKTKNVFLILFLL